MEKNEETKKEAGEEADGDEEESAEEGAERAKQIFAGPRIRRANFC
jgi:hypothetical protein